MIETELPEIDSESSPWMQKILKVLSLASPKFKIKIDAIEALNAELEDLDIVPLIAAFTHFQYGKTTGKNNLKIYRNSIK